MPIILADPPVAPVSRDIFLPFIATAPAIVTPAVVPDVAAFYNLLTTDARQKRTNMQRCEQLEAAALWKARDIALYDYWSHRASNGDLPNETARKFGCVLAPEYAGNWNGCESLVAGSPDAMVMFNALAESPSHRVHLFGLNDFFRQQTHMGIAVATGGQWGWVWVVLIAKTNGES